MFDNIYKIDLQQLGQVSIRGLISLIVLFLITKLLGKKQVSQLSLFDYVIGISIGNFAAEATMNIDIQFSNGLMALLLFGIMAYLVSVLTMKSIVLRRFFMGVPTIIIQNGKIIEANLKRVKFDINDLMEECRNSGYFDISEIEYAVMEVNGKLSILPKGEYKPITVKDMNLKPTKQELCCNAVIDGKIMNKNLSNYGKNEDWLIKELKVKGYNDLSNILLATIDNNEKVNVYEKNKDEYIKSVLE